MTLEEVLTDNNNTVPIESYTSLTKPEQWILALSLTVFVAMGFFGNLVVLYLVKLYRPSHQYRPGRCLLMWMFSTDFGLTCLMLLPATLNSFGWSGLPSGSVLCDMFGYTETALAAVENLIVLLMSVERVLTIYFPLRKILNVRRTNISGGTCVVLSVLLATINLVISRYVYNPDALRCLADFYPPQRYVQLFIMGSTVFFVLFPLVATIIVYLLIIRMVVTRSKINKTNNSSSHSWQAIKTTLLIVGVYLVATLPFIFSRLYTMGTGKVMPLRFRLFCTVTYMLNTAVNPYVYMLTNRSLRNQGKSIIMGSRATNGFSSENSQSALTRVLSRHSRTISTVSAFRTKMNPESSNKISPISTVEEGTDK